MGWIIKRRSRAEHKLLEEHRSEVMSLGKGAEPELVLEANIKALHCNSPVWTEQELE